MFVSKNFIFLELHKTGCTHIRSILKELLEGDLIGSHNQASPHLFTEGRFFLGSIRDPWAWYVSLWASGCDKKGGVFRNVIRTKDWLRAVRWAVTYKNVNDANAFRVWLYMMHDAKYLMDIREGYGKSAINRTAGLLTFRFLKLFCTKRDDSKKLNSLSTFDQIKNYEHEFCFIDRFIRNENLEADLFRILENFSVNISAAKKSEILSLPKSNVSPKRHGLEYYYDSKSENLIAEREKLIIEKFGYIAPSQRLV